MAVEEEESSAFQLIEKDCNSYDFIILAFVCEDDLANSLLHTAWISQEKIKKF